MLNQLKIDGVLPRDCILRKTMLDDCAGEKFEEVLFLFSTVVLRKVLKARQLVTRKHGGAASAIGIGVMSLEEEDVLLPPFTLALRHSLQESLQQRQQIRTNLSSLSTRIREIERGLETRTSVAKISLDTSSTESSAVLENHDNMRRLLQGEHNGNGELLDLILDGEADKGRIALVEDRFGSVWKAGVEGAQLQYDDTPKGLLADLEQRVRTQKARIDYWRQFQKQVSQRNEELVVLHSPAKSPTRLRHGKPERIGRLYNGLTRLKDGQIAPFTPPIKTSLESTPSRTAHRTQYETSDSSCPARPRSPPKLQYEGMPQSSNTVPTLPGLGAVHGDAVAAATEQTAELNISRPQTPTEALFADDADPSSVFKSRSKLRQTISQSMKAPWDA